MLMTMSSTPVSNQIKKSLIHCHKATLPLWPVDGTQVADRTGYQSGSQPKEACPHGHRKAPDAAVVVDVTSV